MLGSQTFCSKSQYFLHGPLSVHVKGFNGELRIIFVIFVDYQDSTEGTLVEESLSLAFNGEENMYNVL